MISKLASDTETSGRSATMNDNTKNIFCADDWGISPAVNDGIMLLAERGTITSVSLFANLPYLDYRLDELKNINVDLSLHLNFTLGCPLLSTVSFPLRKDKSFYPFGFFLALLFLGLIRRESIEKEATAQLLSLQKRGLIIREIAGHQHIHLFPKIFRAIYPLLVKNSLRIRIMDDIGHIPTYLMSRFFLRWQKWSQLTCLYQLISYLRGSDVRSEKRLLAKLRKTKNPILVHPADGNDFDSILHKDKLQAQRKIELEAILKCIS